MGLLKFLARLFGFGRNEVENAENQRDYDFDDQELDALEDGNAVRYGEKAEADSTDASTDVTDDASAQQPIETVLVDARDDSGDDLDDALSAAFLGDGPAEPVTEASVEQPSQDGGPRDLFAGIASNYARPIKNFMCDLQRGEATKQWIEICLPVTQTIIEAAESLDLDTVAERMGDFGAALTIAQGEQGHVLGGESRDLLLSCYEELVELLPEAFVLEERDERRESIIIHSLLQQIDGMGRVTFEKLYAAGLTTLDALVLANKEDLALVAGVPEWLCEQVCNKVQEHHEQLTGDSHDGGQSFLRARLTELVGDLRKQHEIFEEACAEPTPSAELDAKKRDSRRERQACALRVNVLLAEMGNLDLVESLQKLAFGRRIEMLESYVQQLEKEFLATPVLAMDDVLSSDQMPSRR